MRSRAALVVVMLVALGARLSRADDEPLPFTAIPQGTNPVFHAGHWSDEEARPFISLRADVGYLYLKPRFAFGYGKPFALWGGFDVAPFVTPDTTGAYGGLHLQLDWFDIRVGARLMHSLSRNYLAPQVTYTIVDIAKNTNRPTDYLGLEVEATAAIPAGPGNILALFTVESLQFVPKNTYVFDEVLRVVISPPPAYRGRLGYSLTLGREHIARLGLVGEVIEIPDRNAQVVRVGLIGSFDIDDHLQIIGTVLIPVYTPDSLGLLSADYSEIGLRYRWATGHAHVPRERPGTPGP